MASQSNGADVRVEVISRSEDVIHAFDIVYACFGVQVPDAIIHAMNPGVDTPEGRARAADRMADRWRSITQDSNGQPNTIYLKATLPGHSHDEQKIVGFAIWVQVSAVSGHGNPPVDDLSKVMDFQALYPEDESERQYAMQLDRALHRQRNEFAKSKSGSNPPAIMVLDLCVVHPEFQRRGIASKLVQWGLDEAKRRGGLDCSTEASPMGRTVYAKLGFRQEGEEIEYGVEGAKFARGGMPSNIFMRTGINA